MGDIMTVAEEVGSRKKKKKEDERRKHTKLVLGPFFSVPLPNLHCPDLQGLETSLWPGHAPTTYRFWFFQHWLPWCCILSWC